MQQIKGWFDGALQELHALESVRDRAAYLGLWLLHAFLWVSGAAVWFFRIGDCALHGQFLFSALWLLGCWVITATSIPTRCLLTLFSWSVVSTVITFIPWGIKIACAEMALASAGIALMVVYAIWMWLREAFQRRIHPEAPLTSIFTENEFRDAGNAEPPPSVLKILLGVWMWMSLMTACEFLGDLFTATRGMSWREIWTGGNGLLVIDSVLAGFALVSAGLCKWRLYRMDGGMR